MKFNAQFARPAREIADLYRAVAADVDLLRILATNHERVVQIDWTVQWHNAF